MTLACKPQTEATALSSLGVPLPVLANAYEGSASFCLLLGSASEFTPIGIPGSGPMYYKHVIAPHLNARVRTLEGATHDVAMQSPGLLASVIVEELEGKGVFAV